MLVSFRHGVIYLFRFIHSNSSKVRLQILLHYLISAFAGPVHKNWEFYRWETEEPKFTFIMILIYFTVFKLPHFLVNKTVLFSSVFLSFSYLHRVIWILNDWKRNNLTLERGTWFLKLFLYNLQQDLLELIPAGGRRPRDAGIWRKQLERIRIHWATSPMRVWTIKPYA